MATTEEPMADPTAEPAERKPVRKRLISGPGILLVWLYGVMVVGAVSRSAVQISTEFGHAPLAYSLSAVAGVVYGFMIQSYYDHVIQTARWTPVVLGGLFVVVGNAMGKLRPNWMVGVRTPWTLSSKRSWDRTHRLAGWMFVGAGLVFWIAAALAPGRAIVPGVVALITGALVSVIYSYVVWRDDPDKTPPAGTSPAEEPRA